MQLTTHLSILTNQATLERVSQTQETIQQHVVQMRGFLRTTTINLGCVANQSHGCRHTMDCIMVQHYILSLIKLMPTACILWYQNLQFQESCQHHREALSITVFSVQTIDELLANSRSTQVTGASHYSSSCNMTSEQLSLCQGIFTCTEDSDSIQMNRETPHTCLLPLCTCFDE